MNESLGIVDGAFDALFESDYRPIALVGLASHEMSSEHRIEVHSDFGLTEQCQLQALSHQRSVAGWQQRRWSVVLRDIQHDGDRLVQCNAAGILQKRNSTQRIERAITGSNWE